MAADETPLFPLRAGLFPGGHLALRVFEPRYLDMVQRCHAQGRPFGVVALTEGDEVRRREGEGFQREAFHTVGTFAAIEDFEPVQPGLIHLRARGTQRFLAHDARCLSHGLWVCRAEVLPDDAPVAVPAAWRSLRANCRTCWPTGAARPHPSSCRCSRPTAGRTPAGSPTAGPSCCPCRPRSASA